MRLLFLSSSGHLGGAEQVLWDMLEGLHEAKPNWQMRLIAANEGALTARTRTLGITTSILPFPAGLATFGDSASSSSAKNRRVAFLPVLRAGLQSFKYVAALRRAIREFQPDIIHSNGLKMHLLGARAKPRNIPLIWHLHDFTGSRRLMARLLRHHQSKCDLVIANSQAVAADFLASCTQCMPVHAIHNAVDVHLFAPEGNRVDLDALAKLAPARSGTIRVGLVATMAWWKGHKVFLRALSMLPMKELPLRAYIVGDAIYQTSSSQTSLNELRQYARELNLHERVGFTGFVEDTPAVMRALDIVVHASTEPEPFGRVVIEAMACGRPVISTCNGGTKEITAVGEYTLAYAPQDPAALAAAITELVSKPGLRKEMGEAGRRKAALSFSRERFIRELIEAYSQLLSNDARLLQTEGAGRKASDKTQQT